MKWGQICIIALINIKTESRKTPKTQEYGKKLLHFII